VSRTLGEGGFASAVVDIPATEGETYVGVEMVEGDDRTVVHDAVVDLKAGERLVLQITDETDTAVEAGEKVFSSSGAGCLVCHSLEPGEVIVGPSLAGVGSRAGDLVEGLTAAEYIEQSIREPDAYVVEGFDEGTMPSWDGILSDSQIESLVAYLLTLDS
jgi:mono/diheme cytochrome c family protein